MIVLFMLSFFACLVYLYVGIKAYKLNRSSKINKIFLLLCTIMAIWSFAYSFAYIAEDDLVFSLWNKISAFGWCTFSSIILYLVLEIVESNMLRYKTIKAIILLPAFIFLYMSLFLFGPNIKTPVMIENFFYIGNFTYNFSYLLYSILKISIWGRKSIYIRQKIQAKIIAIASGTPFLLNLLTQTILPNFGVLIVPPMGQIYSLIMILGVYIAITKYRFMNIPVSAISDEILAEIMDVVIVLDPEGKIIRINSHSSSLLGFHDGELLNVSIIDIIHDEQIIDLLKDKYNEKEVLNLPRIYFKSKNGQAIPLKASFTPIIDPKIKDVLAIVIVGQDIRTIIDLENEMVKHKETAHALKLANKEIEKINEELGNKNATLIKTNSDLHNKSIRDSLTGVINHQYANQMLEKEIEIAKHYHHNLSVMMLDIDHFKSVNDQYGHQMGDQVLIEVSRTIENNLKKTDIIGRYGGEEFFIILPKTGINDAILVGERIRKSIGSIKLMNKSFNVTASIGVVEYGEEDAAEIISKADKLMYLAKRNGRNKVAFEGSKQQ